jgi:hypothetical protein
MMRCLRIAGRGKDLQIWRVAANMLRKVMKTFQDIPSDVRFQVLVIKYPNKTLSVSVIFYQISGFHGGEYEDDSLLGYSAV